MATWTVLWSILAVLHVTQAVWSSAGANYPGDLGDGRFNQLVLEHGFQSWRGVYHWSSPAQFYPVPDTLGYSDTHLGTLPIYAALRWLGLSLEGAWQAWFVVIAVLNALAALRLLRAWGIGGYLLGPLAFAAVASATMVWLAGTHMQMLPMFPILLAWAELKRWAGDRRALRLVRASGWLAWQFAAGPYLAFFGVVLAIAVGLVAAGTRRGPATPAAAVAAPAGPVWRERLVTALVGVLGWTMAVLVVRIYWHSTQNGAARSMMELNRFAPTMRDWFFANPLWLWYPSGWPARNLPQDLAEHAWFAGFLPWIGTAGALVYGWRHRSEAQARWAVASAGGLLLAVLFFTRWSDAHPGAWIALAEHCQPLRAFRASGRIAGLLQVVMVLSGGLMLASWQEKLTGRLRWLPVGLAILLAIEGLAAHQPGVPLALARARSNATIAAWRRAGDRPILALALGKTNQPEVYFHLDAWSAALRLKRATLNGYSGGAPGSHLQFLWTPTAANARALAAACAIPPAQLAVVEAWSPEDEARLGVEHVSDLPREPLREFDLQPSAWQLFAPLELWPIEGVPMYQFTPPAEVEFRLPDRATRIEYLIAFRPDGYSGGGQSDGVGLTWLLRSADQSETKLAYELLTPLTNPAHRGLLPRSLAIPPGHDRVLIFRTDPGPAGLPMWDFPLLGRLKTR